MNSRKVFLVTGASGFVGTVLCNSIRRSDDVLRLLVRKIIPNIDGEQFVFKNANDIDQDAFLGVDIVIHLAGYAHDTSNKKSSSDMYRNVNVDLTGKILDLSVQSKVSKFVFISSVKAGGAPNVEKCFSESFQAEPDNIYGKTKLIAEKKVLEAAKYSSMDVSIIRPALVYGPGMKGNLRAMLSWIDKGWFPALPENGNRRSMVHLDDLVNAIRFICDCNKSNGKVFIVTDGNIYSSYEIYNTMCHILNKPVPKLRVPVFIFNIFSLFNKDIKYKVKKLLGSECYSSEKIEALGFVAKKSLRDMNITEY
ncbi:MAG: NAD-dependent epimerase/dehydratase family protein [Candidatus Marinimicrobia bacterium]|nr:NAD-dependent epimerase/dehydratase family protein [Candidatus Neomarinimicrobiota bacterium]